MIRLLFWIAVIAIGVWLWRRLKNPATPTQATAEQTRPMVRCAHCQLHVLQSEALERDGNWYCSNDHRRKGPRQIDQ